ncbi:MAG: 6-phosphogluconolactonase [Steroidobacteraceae bacterium]
MIFGSRRAEPRAHRAASTRELAVTLAHDVGAELIGACQDRGSATLVLSGGRTPIPFFEQLRGIAFDWSCLTISLADDRWVDPDSADSNEKLLRDHLLVGAAARARLVPLKNAAPSAAAGADLAWNALQALPRPLDVVILGMGDDGHFASLFAQSPGVQDALDPAMSPACVAMTASVQPYERLSLNLAALLQTRRLILHITGEHKWQVYQSALREAKRNAQRLPTTLPISAVLAQTQVPLDVYWSP